MVKPSESGQDSSAYQQALDDFSITQLLSRISNYSDANFDSAWMHLTEQELESIAALLIQQLTANLKGNLIASYLNILRHPQEEIIFDLPTAELKALSTPTALPPNFPQQTTAPLFWCGDPIRWIPQLDESETNTGIIIGRFYAYAQHRAQWAWKYLIWLTDSSSLVVADTAWEQDIQPLVEENAA
ncbi:hypothetical protein H6F98_22015 [Microcoleus sp. FACHB-SPT15]|uniref:hypothetical protein n=1 Tax=Microcoleus sp. FACHB-SPT15 TaxID=2692830 RepID=UPI00177CE0AA|nr:hypothetical protein [Microcoleus sp. FACHB-SPT15]MBD1808109.1 hypothetical protein [Microcoleus sp. FACHB-SPT15]